MASNSPLRMAFVLPSVSPDGKAIVPSHHPIMTATCAAVARQQGAVVLVVDAALQGLSPTEVVDLLGQWKPDWIAFVPCEYRRELPLDSTLETARVLKKSHPDVFVGLLNVPQGNLPSRRCVEEKKLDFVVFGDAEPAHSLQ